MEQYIPKSALVAEIERRLNYRVESLKAINDGTYWKEDQSEDKFNESLARCTFNAAKNELFELKCFLDTLEVKEVDLEKEIDDAFLENKCNITDNVSLAEFVRIAKHFFELGIKAQKGE